MDIRNKKMKKLYYLMSFFCKILGLPSPTFDTRCGEIINHIEVHIYDDE